MDKRIRSPNYPAISLPDAVTKVTTLYRAIHTHAAPRAVVAKGMGYNTLNGASATAISALHKYGLLERIGDEIKVSERALSILHPHTPQEKADAIRAAAGEPALFAELNERFPGRCLTRTFSATFCYVKDSRLRRSIMLSRPIVIHQTWWRLRDGV